MPTLLLRIQEAIDAGGLQERTRAGMRRLLEELALHADTDEPIPTLAELARRLGVRRTTLWDHLERLRVLARQALDLP